MRWKVRKLKELCIIRPPKSEARRLAADDLVSFVPMEDLPIGGMYLTTTKERSLQEVAGSYTYFADNDVLLAKITPCFENGKLSIARNLKNGVGFGSSEYFVLRTLDELVPEYLYYFFSQETFRLEAESVMGGAVGHKRVPLDFVENTEIPFPSINEQHRIVSILTEAFAAIDKAKEAAEKNLKNARELFESYLQGVFANPGEGWKNMSLGEVCSFKNGVNFDKSHKTGKGILTVDVLNMYAPGLKVDTTSLYRVDKLIPEDYLLSSGDILIVRSSVKKEGVAWATYFETASEPITFCGFIIRGRPRLNVNPKFIVYFLRSPIVRQELVKKSVQSTITNINQTILSEVMIAIPSLAEQQSIVTQLDTLSTHTKKLETIYTKKLSTLEEVKKSILTKAFAGELSRVPEEA